jgi:phosphatidylglycerophosphate synthase
MFDRYLHPLAGRLADRLAPSMASWGVSADQVSIAGFIVGLMAMPLLGFGQYGLALLAFLANRLLDALDGALARFRGASDRGAFLDIALDFFVYGAMPVGFALADPTRNALASTILLLSFIGTGTSFLALAIFAERRRMTAAEFPRKGLYYLGGLAEGFETIICFAAMCLFPQYYPIFAAIFAALCFITAVLRWWWGYRLLSS